MAGQSTVEDLDRLCTCSVLEQRLREMNGRMDMASGTELGRQVGEHPQERTIEVDRPEAVYHGAFRRQASSWEALPQELRGITLGELWIFHNDHRDWLKETRWRCNDCKRSWNTGTHYCANCKTRSGNVQSRNLYEVVVAIIKPTCQTNGISYVEHLSLQNARGGVAVDTFVSHWWGEEFCKLVRSLDHYAASRCATMRPYRRTVVTCTLASFMLPSLFAFVFAFVTGGFTEDAHIIYIHKVETIQGPEFHGYFRSLIILGVCALFLEALIFILSRRLLEKPARDRFMWSFWICAFANNQFAIDHATGANGDIFQSAFAVAMRSDCCMEMVAVLDQDGTLYRRIWCAFELFFGQVVMPQHCGRSLEVAIANEHGLVSDGDASITTLNMVHDIIDRVRVVDAEASVPEDKHAIDVAINREGVTPGQLDEILKKTAQDGLAAARRRRNAPLVIFAGMPAFSLGFQRTFFPDGLSAAAFAETTHVNVIINASAMILTAAFNYWALVGCRFRRSKMNAHQLRLLNRSITILILTWSVCAWHVAMVLASVRLLDHRQHDETDTELVSSPLVFSFAILKASYRLCFTCSITSGVFLWVFYDRPWLRRRHIYLRPLLG